MTSLVLKSLCPMFYLNRSKEPLFGYKGRRSSKKQLVFFGIRKSPLPKVFFRHDSQPSPASGLVAFILLHRVLSIWRH